MSKEVLRFSKYLASIIRKKIETNGINPVDNKELGRFESYIRYLTMEVLSDFSMEDKSLNIKKKKTETEDIWEDDEQD